MEIQCSAGITPLNPLNGRTWRICFICQTLFKPLVEQPLPKVLRVRDYPGCVRVDDLHLRRLIGVFGVWELEAKLATTEGFERFCTLGPTAVLGNGIISNDDLLLRRIEGLGDVFHDGWVVLAESLMSTKLLHVLSVAWAADPLHGVAKPSRDMNNGRANR